MTAKAIKGVLAMIFSRHLFIGFIAALAACMARSAQAIEPSNLTLGVFELQPSLRLEQRYDDNVLSQPSDERQSWVTLISPIMKAKAELSSTGLMFEYHHIAALYASSSDDDFNDNFLSGAFYWEPNYRNRLDVAAAFGDGHEDRGTGFSQGPGVLLIDSPDTFQKTEFDLRYSYGGLQSSGRLVFDLGRFEKQFTNNRGLTRARDWNENNLGLGFYWLMAGSTEVFLEARYSDIDYVRDPVQAANVFDTLDSQAQKYFVGLKWRATGNTEGRVKLGLAKKDFADADREDFSGNNWELSVNWMPLEHSVLALSSGREARETNGKGSYIDERNIFLTWSHAWSELIRSQVFYNFVEESYQGSADERVDKAKLYGLRVDHTIRPWLALALSFQVDDNDSSLGTFDYKRRRASLHASVSL